MNDKTRTISIQPYSIFLTPHLVIFVYNHLINIVLSCDLVQIIVLLWLLTAASIKTGRPQIARRAVDLAEARLWKDGWPEYYDGKSGRFIGKQARKFQTWSIAGYLVAKMMMDDPTHVGMISMEEEKHMRPLLKRSSSWS